MWSILLLSGFGLCELRTIVQILPAGVRDLDKWSPRMRAPFEEVYGKEYFKSQWNQWIDAYKSYLDEHDGDIVRNQIHEIKKATLIIHGQVTNMQVSDQHLRLYCPLCLLTRHAHSSCL